jgi:hypothetical protein
MAAFTWNSSAGGLTINNVDMMAPAWQVRNLHDLWLPANQRGEDRIIPGVSGRKAYRRFADTTTRTLLLKITGDVNSAGTPQTNKFQGLQANIDALITSVVNPTDTGDGTRTLVLTMPSGGSRSEPVHVTGMSFGGPLAENGRWITATIDLSIPAGRII